MRRRLLLGASLGWGLGPAAAAASARDWEQHAALRHGAPATSRVRASEDFVVCFDYRTRNPAWVVERLTAAALGAAAGGGRAGGSFREAADVPARLRSRLAHYRHSGLDRGHLAPAADHWGTVRDTFALDNVSPQVGAGFNRDAWARLEQFCRDATGACDAVYVVTGPLYLPGARDGAGLRMAHRVLGDPPAVTHVPTHFFKVVLAESAAGAPRYGLGCFVLPNADLGGDVDLRDYAVDLASLEAAAGLLPFGDLLTPRRRAALVAAEDRWLRGRGDVLAGEAAADHDAAHVRTRDRAADTGHLLDVVPQTGLRPRRRKPP